MIKKILIFTAGAAIGSLVTWKIVEQKYKKLADEEIESVVERFKEREKERIATSMTINSDGIEIRKDDKVVAKINAPETPWGPDPDYEEIATGYKNEDEETNDDEFENCDEDQNYDEYGRPVGLTEEYIEPYVISPEEFGEFGNKIVSLMYYADGILADDDDVIVSDPENVIGNALSQFGRYEEDAVHVRDENIETDYEILRSLKTFDEIIHKGEN